MRNPTAIGCLVLALAACSSQAGDPPSQPQPSTLGQGKRIREVSDPTRPDHPGQNAQVTVTGVTVLVVDAFDETGDGKSKGAVYVQDVGTPLPYSGIELFQPTYSPADLHVAPGDVLDLTGAYQDFPGPGSSTFPPGQVLPELAKPLGTFRFEYKVPDPKVIQLSDLFVADQAHFDAGRKWLGMLVTINDVTAVGAPAGSKGRLYAPLTADANAPSISNELYDLKSDAFPAGTHFSSITGICTYFFSFHIAPRSADDLKP